jgi:hypothetical protein
MSGTAKVKSGSKAGKVQYPYDAMVYIDGTTVYAVDKEGNVIRRGVAGTDDAAVIQAALAVGGVTQLASNTSFNTTATIEVTGTGISLRGGVGTTITASLTTIDVIKVYNAIYCTVEDVAIVLPASSTKSGLLLWVYREGGVGGIQKHISHCAFKNIKIAGNTYSDITCGIRFFGVSSYYVWNTFENIEVSSVNRGVEFDFDDPGIDQGTWCNANYFKNFEISQTVYGWAMNNSNTYGHDFAGNTINSIQIQADLQQLVGISIWGARNIFDGALVWDATLPTDPGFKRYYFLPAAGANDAAYLNTLFALDESLSDIGESSAILAGPGLKFGNSNRIYSPLIPVVKDENVRVISKRVGSNFTTLSSAFAAITDASATNRYTFYVIGDISETSLVTAKSYIDVIGLGQANIIIDTTSNGSGVTINNLVFLKWENLIITRRGIVTGDSPGISIVSCDSTVKLKNITVENEITENYAAIGISVIGSIYAQSNPILIDCNATGGGGTSSHGIYLAYHAQPTIIGGTFTGGSSRTTSHGFMVDTISSPNCFGCTGISGNGATGCYGIYIDGGSSVFDSCTFTYKQHRASMVYTGTIYSSLPFASKPYFIKTMFIWVTTAGGVGSVIDIGTSDGGTEIAAAVPCATTGYKYFSFTKSALASDAPIYFKPSDINTRFTAYYIVGYNYGLSHAAYFYNRAGSNFRITNCNILSNRASRALAVITNPSGTKDFLITNCLIEPDNPLNYAIDSAIPDIPIYNSTINGLLLDVPSFASNANNSGRGSITVSLLRPEINSVLEILGTPKLLSLFAEVTGTSITDYTRFANILTAAVSVATYYGFQGRATYYDLNGTSHYLYRANDTDFDFGNAVTDQAFSLVCCVNPDDVTSRQIIGKWDVNNLREWRLFFDANGYPTLQLYDESVDKYIGRQDQTAFTTGTWQILVATYDGSGICAGCKLYIDGVQLDDADYTDAGYVAMEAINTNLMVGALKNAAAYSEYYDGKMTWIGIAAKELSADEVWSLTQRLKGVLGV